MRRWTLFLTVIVCGCTLARVNVEVLSQRTALENQILGTYNALDRQMLLSASVRAVDTSGRIGTPPRQSPARQDAMAAMQVLEFHADDLRGFKQLGWAGENNRGFIEAFAMEKENVPDAWADFATRYTQAEFDSVVSAINQARRVLMDRVIEMNENLSAADMPQVEAVFGKLHAENALSGERVQDPSGRWTTQP